MNSLESLSVDLEARSGLMGKYGQKTARQRLEANKKRKWHQDKDNVERLILAEQKAVDSDRLSKLLTDQWYHDRSNYELVTKLTPKMEEKVRELMSDRFLKF